MGVFPLKKLFNLFLTQKSLNYENFTSDSLNICCAILTKSHLIYVVPAVSGPKPLPPSDKCCAVLTKADLPCLCTFKNSPMLSTFKINSTLAMELPSKCKLDPPNCSV